MSGKKDSTLLPDAYFDSSNPTEEERNEPGVVPKKGKTLERRTEGCRVGPRGGVESDSSPDGPGNLGSSVPDGFGILWRGGVSPRETVRVDAAGDKGEPPSDRGSEG